MLSSVTGAGSDDQNESSGSFPWPRKVGRVKRKVWRARPLIPDGEAIWASWSTPWKDSTQYSFHKWYRVGKEREHEGAQNGRFERRRHLEIIDMNLISDGWPGVSRWNQFWNFFEIILHTFRYWAPTDPSCVVLVWELNKKVYIYLQSQSNISKSYFSQGQRKQCSISLHRCPPWPVGCRASFERSQGAGLGLKKPESWTLHKESRPDQFHFHFICQRFYTMYNVCKHRWKLYHLVRPSLLPGDRMWTHQGSRRIPEGHLKGSGIRYL